MFSSIKSLQIALLSHKSCGQNRGVFTLQIAKNLAGNCNGLMDFLPTFLGLAMRAIATSSHITCAFRLVQNEIESLGKINI